MATQKATHQKKITWGIFAILFTTLILRLTLWFAHLVPFNSDEAVLGLMAKHILLGERPLFFYGSPYLGSLDAYLVSGMYRIFGQNVFSIRLTEILVYIAYVWSFFWLGKKFIRDTRFSWLPAAFAVIPPVLVTTYTAATVGGYGESILLGNFILGFGYDVTLGDRRDNAWYWAALGVVGGLGLWTLAMTGVYLLPVVIWGLMRFRWKRVPFYALSLAFFILGSAPWWFGMIQTSGAPLAAWSRSFPEQVTIGQRLLWLFVFALPAVIGFRFPWQAFWQPWYFTGPFIVVNTVCFWTLIRKPRGGGVFKAGVWKMIGGMGAVLLAVMILTYYGNDPTGRYFIPLFVVLVFAWSEFIILFWSKKKVWGIIFVILWFVINGGATLQAALAPELITTQFNAITRFDNSHDEELIQFLETQGEKFGYSNYWVSYRLSFLTDEQVIFSPRVPYREDLEYNPGENRYPLYDELVNKQNSVAYITTQNPKLDDVLRDNFRRLGVTWQEKLIGPYNIFYCISAIVRPEQLVYP